MRRPVTFYLTAAELMWVLAFHLILLLGGIATLLWCILAAILPADVAGRSVIAGIATGAAGSAAYYIRRVYRAAFDERLVLPSRVEHRIERIGSLVYLVGRPLMSMLFALIAALTAVLSNTAATPAGVEPTVSLIYINAGVGFIAGFLGGRFIKSIEKTGKV